MIELRIEPYCHECPNFDVRHDVIFYDDKANHSITCSHSEQCQRLKEYLEKHVVASPLLEALKPASNENRCVICGVDVPEGRHVCPKCEEDY